MVEKAGKYALTAVKTTAAGLGVIWAGKKIAERAPVPVVEDVLDELTGD